MSILFDVTNVSVPSLSSKNGVIIDAAKRTTTDLTIRFADMLVAAGAVCSALAWNDAFKSLFVEGGVFYKFAKGGPWVAAIVITLVAISLGYWRTKLMPPTPKK
jgi:hypothetical protein